MATLGFILLAVGGIAAVVGGIWLLIEAFRTSVLWGLGSLFIPFVSLIFAIKYWGRAGRPFLIALGGGIVAGIGSALSAGGMSTEAATLLAALI